MDSLRPEAFFDASSFRFQDLFAECNYVWDALRKIGPYLRENLTSNVKPIQCFGRPFPKTVVVWRDSIWEDGFKLLPGDVPKGEFRVNIEGEETTDAVVLFAGSVLMDDEIYLGPGCVVEPGALIKGPTMVGAHTEIRQGAYIRGKCIVGDRCVVGHTTEMKSSVMLNEAKAGHFAYIGDSILGNASNLGAGTKLANLRIMGTEVRIRIGKDTIGTGMRKLGAILGDNVEIGCNSVTNPGTLLGKGSIIYPVTSVRAGYYEPQSIVRTP